MSKHSGKDGKVRFNLKLTINNAVHAAGTVTVTTSTSHGYSVGDLVEILAVVGMTDLNAIHVVTGAPTGTTFTVALTTAQSYTSGGTSQNIIHITNWEATIESDVKNVTDSSSASGGWEENIPSGFRRATGSFEGFVLDGSNRIPRGSRINIELWTDTTDNFVGNGIVVSETLSNQVHGGEAQKFTANFTADSAITETVA